MRDNTEERDALSRFAAKLIVNITGLYNMTVDLLDKPNEQMELNEIIAAYDQQGIPYDKEELLRQIRENRSSELDQCDEEVKESIDSWLYEFNAHLDNLKPFTNKITSEYVIFDPNWPKGQLEKLIRNIYNNYLNDLHGYIKWLEGKGITGNYYQKVRRYYGDLITTIKDIIDEPEF
jgi:hypothetical protein